MSEKEVSLFLNSGQVTVVLNDFDSNKWIFVADILSSMNISAAHLTAKSEPAPIPNYSDTKSIELAGTVLMSLIMRFSLCKR
ncbi:MAG: hypothetical protein HOF35_07040 [Bacteroidetes bacterium]|jgi:hypothetical protein|nr:hypothetical protein [Bacteroidota bacterium]